MIRDNDVDLDQLLEDLTRPARQDGIQVVDGAVHAPDGVPAWMWSGDVGTEPTFVALARQVGTRIIYSHKAILHLDELIRSELTDNFLVDFEEDSNPTAYQVLIERMDLWWRRDNQTYAVHLAFVHAGVIHNLFLSSQWMEDLGESLANAIEELKESDVAERRTDWQRERAEVREKATILANDKRYAKARNDGQRKYVAEELFPDIDSHRLRDIVETSGYIFWDEVEPELERQLARRVQELIEEGETVTAAASTLGISRDRLNRLLYMDLDNT